MDELTNILKKQTADTAITDLQLRLLSSSPSEAEKRTIDTWLDQ